MGREKKRSLPAAVAGGPKERHKRAQRSQFDPTAPVPPGFVAKPAPPKTKHHSYFEFVENKDKKKKKLEFQITTKKTPPPGFEFVPAGNPELTAACKELSREKDAMIFVVSNAKDVGVGSNILAHQVHRVGHHIREIIVEEARNGLGQLLDRALPACGGSPEPIPESQDEYDAQVDAALRDLFPRIPNTDRQMIIEHAFRRGTTSKGEKKVGLSADITLARRVQLAVLAHIRHTHTRYDTLLKETTWQNARKVVEALCLDTLVKWRGDEESGRDQLDEILREVVVISDSDEESGDETDDSSIEETAPQPIFAVPSRAMSNVSGQIGPGRRQSPRLNPAATGPPPPAKPNGKVKKAKRKTSAEKKGHRGFKRYQAWQEALQRYRGEKDTAPQPPLERSTQYAHAPPVAAVAYGGDEFPAASQLRNISERAGPAPTENGYVGKPYYPSSQLMNPGRRSYSPAPRPLTHNKVKSPFYEPQFATHQPVSRATSHLQDLLVPSIEPVSPETMKPSFVRTVPPRGQVFRDKHHPGPMMQHSSTMLSPSRGLAVRDEPVRITRHLGDERFAYRTGPYDAQHDNHGLRREQNLSPSHNGNRLAPAPLYHSDTRPQGLHNPPPTIAVSRRPYEDAPRVADRGAPILMEDRGGFYERVPVRIDGTHLAPRHQDVDEYRRPAREAPRAPEQHRVLSWPDLRKTRGNAGAEMIPTSSVETRPHHTLAQPRVVMKPVRAAEGALMDVWRPEEHAFPPVSSRPRVSYFPSAAAEGASGVVRRQEEPALVYLRAPGPGNSAPRYEPQQDMRHDERMLDVQDYREPIQRYYRNEPLPPDNRRRGYPLHPKQPENVIVLE
ncbi:hypothetical protein FZEAL_5813 [Fusarium zealandicum]|uniref:DUF2293 domain-containing protein n=1 Tax=Fusarium zealandicum TaxID=1053134 RepID=A0A8H4XJF9_9HYPO|nr:hypothetical protein FZEAL_5813 [Fusarium zealandicum]